MGGMEEDGRSARLGWIGVYQRQLLAEVPTGACKNALGDRRYIAKVYISEATPGTAASPQVL